jgi:hypothetical protein
MRKCLILALLPALVLGGCAVFGGGRTSDAAVAPVARNKPLVIPRDFTLPPPTQQAGSRGASASVQLR